MANYKYAVLATALFSTACAGAASEGDGALVVDYDPHFQAAVMEEYGALPISCQPNDPDTPPGCSAIKSMINDYMHLRARLRVD
jgi:hypothetical protein